MKKELKDYLHLYLGCTVLCESQSGSKEPNIKRITGLSYDDIQRQWWCYFENDEESYLEIEFLKPILRLLSDMTEDEKANIEGTDWTNMVNGGWEYSPETFLFLLSKQFDLFDLIEAGFAVNAAELQTITE